MLQKHSDLCHALGLVEHVVREPPHRSASSGRSNIRVPHRVMVLANVQTPKWRYACRQGKSCCLRFFLLQNLQRHQHQQSVPTIADSS